MQDKTYTQEDLMKLYWKFLSSKGIYDEDLMSDLFLYLWEVLPKYDPSKGALGTFIYTVLSMQLKSLHRRTKAKKRQAEFVHLDDTFSLGDKEEVSTADYWLSKTASVNQLRSAEDTVVDKLELSQILSTLKPIEQQVVTYLNLGYTQKDIAVFCNTSPPCIYRHIKKIKHKLQGVRGAA